MTKSSKPAVGGTWRRRIPHRNVWIVIALLAVFDVAFWAVAVRPLSNREEQRRVRLASLEQQIEQRRASVEKLEAATERVESATETGDGLLEQLTLDRQTTYSTLLSELVEASDEAGVQFRETSFETVEVEGNEAFGRLRVSANFRGNYENLVQFLNRLDRSEQFLIIEQLGAAPSDEGGLRFSIRIDTFVRGL